MMRAMSRAALLVGHLTALHLAACGSAGGAGSAVAPDTPTAAGALGEADPACTGVPRRPEPLVVDWRSSDRADLEVAMKDSLAVVHGCDGFRLLKACSAKGSYGFAGVRRKEDVVKLTGTDELRANLPIASAGLKAEMDRGATIDLALVVVGKRHAGVLEMARGDLEGDCEGATHVVRAASIGAFAVATGTTGKVASVAELFGAGTSGASASERKSVSKDGDPTACTEAKSSDAEPPELCGSVLRVELVEVTATKGAAAPPDSTSAPLENPCPAGLVLTGGTCTRRAQAGYRCARDDVAECTAQCDAGNGDSCFNLSWLKGKEKERSRALADKACSLGSGEGCQAAAYHRDGKHPEWLSFMAQACDIGQGDACHIAGVYIQRGDARGSAEDVRRMFTRACQLRAFLACVATAWWHVRANDWKTASRTLDAACDGGDGQACGLLGAFHIRCAYGRVAGMSPGDVPMCKKFPKPDAAIAVKALGKACANAWAPGVCQTVAQMLREGQLVKKDVAQAVRYYEIGCATGGYGTCVPLAEIYEKGDGVPKDLERARAMRASACKQGEGDRKACEK